MMAFKAKAKAKVNIPLPLDALKGTLSQVAPSSKVVAGLTLPKSCQANAMITCVSQARGPLHPPSRDTTPGGLISPCSGRDSVKSLRSSFTESYPQTPKVVGQLLTVRL